MRLTDVADTEQLFRLIQSIPSPKAEPFKQWMALRRTLLMPFDLQVVIILIEILLSAQLVPFIIRGLQKISNYLRIRSTAI